MLIAKLRQTGDTIVEVLFAIAVISSVLAGAYLTTNLNTKSAQDAQERSQALKLVESQVELLRAKGSIAANSCFDSTTGNPVTDSGSSTPPNPCIVKVDGTVAGASDQPAYHLRLSTSSSDCASGVYGISADWGSLTSSGNAKVGVCYKL